MSPLASNPPVPAATDPSVIRNFCIIAHIDHGKSTLADRMLQFTAVVTYRQMRAQYLDRMDIERERGITIKSQAVRLPWTGPEGRPYVLNLIDTPGHVDFTYEVSRSLEACEGALLVVDASQGVEAQTLANTYLAVESGLELIPCLNKIDLPGAEPERVADEIAELLGEPADQVRRISAKTGEGVLDVLEELVQKVPPPAGDLDAPAHVSADDGERPRQPDDGRDLEGRRRLGRPRAAREARQKHAGTGDRRGGPTQHFHPPLPDGLFCAAGY